ncbi:hypothetical protein V8E54_009095 [Elaphomyces granulatus]
MEPPQERDFYRRLHSSTRTLLYGPLELQSLQPLTYSGLLYLRERRYKCHHRCLEEEGDDDFVEIDDMLLDELDLEELDLSWLLRRAATTVAMTATATAATTARTVAATVAATATATAATTQPRKRGRPKGSKDKELRKRRQKATGGGDTMATDN